MIGIYKEDFKITLNDVNVNGDLDSISILKMLQNVATIASAKSGFSIDKLKKLNLAWILVNWKLKILKPAKWDEIITIKTWTNHVKGLNSIRDFEIHKGNELIAIASSKWVLINTETFKIIRLTEDITSAYKCIDKKVFDNNDSFVKLKEPETVTNSYNYITMRKDIDSNKHVNNVCYLEYAYEALPNDIYENTIFKTIDISYKHEAKAGENLIFLYSKNQDSHIITIKNSDSNILHAIIKLST